MEIKTHLQSNKILMLPIKDIRLTNIQQKKEPEQQSISRLATSIRKNGLFCPLTVRKRIEDKNGYFLVSGLRRYHALCLLQAETVPVLLLSLTELEAELYDLLEAELYEPLNIMERSSLLNRLQREGKMLPIELADALGITVSQLEEKNCVNLLSNEEKQFVLHHGFSFDFVRWFLRLSQDKKQAVKNHIIVNDLNEHDSIRYIKDVLEPKKEPIKMARLANDVIVMNSVERIADSLRQSGITATAEKRDYLEHTEYILSIEKKLKQLSLLS